MEEMKRWTDALCAGAGKDDFSLDAEYLDKVTPFLREIKSITARKKGGLLVNPAQLKLLNKQRDTVAAILDKAFEAELAFRVSGAMTLSWEAIGNDGYIKHADESLGAKALAIGAIREDVEASDILESGIWEEGFWPGPSLSLAKKYLTHVPAFLGVLGHALSTTNAWKVLGQVPEAELDVQTAGNVKSLFQALGIGGPVVEEKWDRCLFKLFSARAGARLKEAQPLFAGLLDDCVNAKFAGIDKATTNKLVSMLALKSPERKFAQAFLTCVMDYAKFLTGKAGNESLVDTLHTKASDLLQQYENFTASGQDIEQMQNISDLGFNKPEVRQVIDAVLGKVTETKSMAVSTQTKHAKTVVAAMVKLVSTIPTDDEGAFRAKMNTSGKALAKLHCEVKTVCDAIRKTNPAIEQEADTAESTTVSDQAEATLPSLYKQARALEDRCMHYTCVYVALTLFRKPAGSGNRGEAARLASVLETIARLENQIDVFADLIAEMRRASPKQAEPKASGDPSVAKP
jgi:hypothetical protein